MHRRKNDVVVTGEDEPLRWFLRVWLCAVWFLLFALQNTRGCMVGKLAQLRDRRHSTQSDRMYRTTTAGSRKGDRADAMLVAVDEARPWGHPVSKDDTHILKNATVIK